MSISNNLSSKPPQYFKVNPTFLTITIKGLCMYKGKYRDDIDITDIHDFNPSGN